MLHRTNIHQLQIGISVQWFLPPAVPDIYADRTWVNQCPFRARVNVAVGELNPNVIYWAGRDKRECTKRTLLLRKY